MSGMYFDVLIASKNLDVPMDYGASVPHAPPGLRKAAQMFELPRKEDVTMLRSNPLHSRRTLPIGTSNALKWCGSEQRDTHANRSDADSWWVSLK